MISTTPLLSAQWFHCDKSLLQLLSSGGPRVWILFTQRLHLNLEIKATRHNINMARFHRTNNYLIIKCIINNNIKSVLYQYNSADFLLSDHLLLFIKFLYQIKESQWNILVMCVTNCVFIEFEEFFQISQTEVSLYMFLLIHHTATQGLLVSLALEYLLFYGASLQHVSQDCHIFIHSLTHNSPQNWVINWNFKL